MIGAIIGGVAALGGAFLSSRSQKKAANKASAAEVGMARENNALAQQFYDRNTANFQPWMQSGGRANSLVDSFLFGPQQQAAPAQQQQTISTANSGAPNWSAYLQANPDVANAYGSVSSRNFPTPESYAQYHYSRHGQAEGRQLPGTQQYGQPAQVAQPQNALMDGYKAFEASPYYQFPLQEGMRSLNHGLASRGMIESGDAIKSAIRYGQDYGSGRMGEFIGLAERQSDRGVQGASAIAGVGQTALASQSQNNAMIGQSQANRAIAGGVANANMWSGMAGAIGGIAGSWGKSSYGR